MRQVKRYKDFRRNTYKSVTADFPDGGFSVDFYEPYGVIDVDTEEFTSIMRNIERTEYDADEVVIDDHGVWRAKAWQSDLEKTLPGIEQQGTSSLKCQLEKDQGPGYLFLSLYIIVKVVYLVSSTL